MASSRREGRPPSSRRGHERAGDEEGGGGGLLGRCLWPRLGHNYLFMTRLDDTFDDLSGLLHSVHCLKCLLTGINSHLPAACTSEYFLTARSNGIVSADWGLVHSV